MRHTLVILDESEGGGWDIAHEPWCWRKIPTGDDYWWDVNCPIGRVIDNDPHALDPIKNLPPGRYSIRHDSEGEDDRYGEWIVIGCGALADHGPHEGCPGEGPSRAVRS